MITVKKEDIELFEKNGFSKDDIADTINTHRNNGLSDEEITKKMNIKIGMMKNPENVTPYMQIANNPNLTKEEKTAQINALKAKEDEENSLENLNKQYARNKINKINEHKAAHPFLTGLNSMFNPIAEANDNYLKELAETGKISAAGTIKRGLIGGLTTLGGIAGVLSGGAAIGANAAKLNNTAKILKTMGAGSLGFAAPTASNSINKVINEEMTPNEALTETGKSALTGAVLAPVNLVSRAGINNAVKTAMIKDISGKIAKEAIEKNYPLPKEILENLTNRALEAESKQALTGMLMETPSALVSGAADTASIAGIDYGLNTLQGKQQGSYIDHLKEYAPFMGFSALPIASKAVNPAVNKIVNSKTGRMIQENINNSHSLSKMDAEIRNALNLGESNLDNVKKYQTVDKHLQKISGSKVKQLPQEEIKTIIEAGKITPKEQEKLIDSWKNGNKQKSENKNDLTPQDKFNVIRDSKETEKTLIDLGIITAEQAKNRLLQQHKAGKGIYYQQFSNHKLDGIYITRDYLSERNSKKGWFGQKIKEGITDKASVQDIVRNVKLRKIQASNIKEALNFIEKNFAQNLDNGVKQGYVPVNKHLPANAMRGKTTKEG